MAANTYVSHQYSQRGQCYLVSMQLLLVDALLPRKTLFECQLKHTESGAIMKKTMEYVPSRCCAAVLNVYLRLIIFIY